MRGMTMIRKLGVVLVCSLMAGSAFGTIYVSWNGPSGFVRNDGTTPIVETGFSALAQLIFTATGTHGISTTDGSVAGNTVLASFIFDESVGNPYGAGFSAPIHSNAAYTVGSGFLYVRVFDRGSDSSLDEGMWYHDGPVNFATTENDGTPPASPNDVNAGDALAGPGPSGTYILNSGQVLAIPEPTTWALLGLGIVALAGRKFRRS